MTDESLRECAMAALQLYATADGQFRVKQEGQVKFQATFPIAMYAHNQVRAALILAAKNREYLAVANVRVAYEHAVTAQWVLFTEGAEEKLVGSVNRHSRQVVKAMATHAAIPEELQTGYGPLAAYQRAEGARDRSQYNALLALRKHVGREGRRRPSVVCLD